MATPTIPTLLPPTLSCFKCQGFARIAIDCLNIKLISLVEEELCTKKEEDDQPIKWEEEGPSKEELMHANQNEALVVHRSLNRTMVVDEEDLLHHNIFYT